MTNTASTTNNPVGLPAKKPSDILENPFVTQAINNTDPNQFNILMDDTIWPTSSTMPPSPQQAEPLDPMLLITQSWNQPILPNTDPKLDCWKLPGQNQFNDKFNTLPPTPPNISNYHPMFPYGFPDPFMAQYGGQLEVMPHMMVPPLVNHQTLRRASHPTTTPRRAYGRRASSQPSVASVVSLTAHEPVSRIINGVEYITFLYSHDRLVREYTVCTDVNSVDLNDITMDFRIQNAIYPRANVDKSEYDGNRWDYETTCNQLGWKICWLNKEQMYGKRGLIQRAVDSYRNRHAEMRSRRVTRQEKLANGTLRKRRSKKNLLN